MKLIKTASGKQTVKMNKKEWQSIGKTAGWMKSASQVTNKDIEYKEAPYGYIATIPKGTPVIDATNLPDGGYWVENWDSMSEKEESWARNYGFHVTEEDVDSEDISSEQSENTIPHKYLLSLSLPVQFSEMMLHLTKINTVVASAVIQDSFPKEWEEYKENIDAEYSEDLIENFVYKILNKYGKLVEGDATILGRIFYPLAKRGFITDFSPS